MCNTAITIEATKIITINQLMLTFLSRAFLHPNVTHNGIKPLKIVSKELCKETGSPLGI